MLMDQSPTGSFSDLSSWIPAPAHPSRLTGPSLSQLGARTSGYVGLMEPEKAAVRRGSIVIVNSITTWS